MACCVDHALCEPAGGRDVAGNPGLEGYPSLDIRPSAGATAGRRGWTLLLLTAALWLGLPTDQAAGQAAAPTRFLIDYGAVTHGEIAGYDVVVLDPDIAALAVPRRRPGMKVLGYLSLGEIHSGRRYTTVVQGNGMVLGSNPNWPDAQFVDLRDRRWHHLVINQLVPEILAKHFDGIFIDTLDDAEFLEQREPVRFAGMVEQAAVLLRAIRQRFPGMPVMVNRGYAVLPRATGAFDMLLGESVLTTFDSGPGGYRMLSQADYRWQVERMREAQRRDPKLRLFSLDYWNPGDPRGIERIYAQERANGFIPYVGTRDLTRIVPEP
jgi:polysaccharide biosynthesis protein PelA